MLKNTAAFFCFTFILVLGHAQSLPFQWGNQIGGDSSIAHKLMDFKVDPQGNSYALGYFSGTVDFDPGPSVYNLTSSGNYGAYILKLNASGNFVWAKAISNSDRVIPKSLSIDKLGNVYSCGYFTVITDFDPGNGKLELTPTKNNYDGFILKLSASGNFVWAKQLGGTSYNSLESIVCDAQGYLYLTGFFVGQTDFDLGPSKYLITSNGSYDALMLKLNSDGNFIWVKTFGSKKADGNKYIYIDQLGYLYTSGISYDTLNFDPTITNFTIKPKGSFANYIAKYDTTGNFKWAISFGDTLLTYYPNLTVDQNENLFLTGGFFGKVDFDPGTSISERTGNGNNNFYLLKLNANGEMVWVKTLGGFNSEYSMRGDATLTDDTGNVYCIGNFNKYVDFNPDGNAQIRTTSTINPDIFILKYDMYGRYLWSKQLIGSGSEDAINFGFDSKQNLYLGGEFSSKIDCDPDTGTTQLTVIKKNVTDIFIIKFGPNSTSISNLDRSTESTIFPNPTAGILYVKTSNTIQKYSLQVFNMLGILIDSRILTNQNNSIDISNYASGIYVIKLIGDDHSMHIHKIIKQ